MQIRFLLLLVLFVSAFVADIVLGSVHLSLRETWSALTETGGSDVYREIIMNHRLPKALTAIFAGAALSVAGVLMQTLFHNPLAGPDVLGITSGASLGVALLTLGTSSLPLWIIGGWGQVIAAVAGSVGVLLLVIIVSAKVPHTVSLLIIGMMFGYFAGAIVSILQSASNPDTLKLFVTWTFGSLSSVGWEYMRIMAPVTASGIFISFLLQKQLNVLLLGRNYAG
ncbi:iron complex transport system permease protein, partial [termite gut metagenome]